jgi:tetratricopeptide (TPR) repeat protein
VEWRLGNLSEAERVARQAHEIAAAINDTRSILLALNRLGAIVGDLGRIDEEEQCYKQALEIALAAGMRERVAATLNNLGVAAGERKDWPAAWAYYMNALAVSQETGAKHSIAVNHINLGYAGAYLGKQDEAWQYLKEGIRTARAINAAPIVVAGVSYVGALLLSEGKVQRALAIFEACRQNPAYNSESEHEISSFLQDWKISPHEHPRLPAPEWDNLLDELTA